MSADSSVSAADSCVSAQLLAVERDTVPGVANAALDYAADQRTSQRVRTPTLDELKYKFDARLWAVFSQYPLLVPKYRASTTTEADITTTLMRVYEMSSQALLSGQRLTITRDPNNLRRLLVPRDNYLRQRPLVTLYPLTDDPEARAFETHEEYMAHLDRTIEEYAQGRRSDMTLEEYNLVQLRSLAAHDLHLLHNQDVEIVTPEQIDEVVHSFQASERALRILNAINRMRPDARPPLALTDTRDIYSWLAVTSDELLSTYMIDESDRVHDTTAARADTRMRITVSRTRPSAILSDIAQRYGRTLDDMFPSVPLGMSSLHATGIERNRLISIGLLPLVLASMDDRMRVLNSPIVVATYMYNLVRNVIDTHLNTSPHHVAALQQLEHNIDWMRQLDTLSASALVPTTHLYTVAHHNIVGLVHLREHLLNVACRNIIDKQNPAVWAALEAGVLSAMRELGVLQQGQTLLQHAREQLATTETGKMSPDAVEAIQRATKRPAETAPAGEPVAKRVHTDGNSAATPLELQ